MRCRISHQVIHRNLSAYSILLCVFFIAVLLCERRVLYQIDLHAKDVDASTISFPARPIPRTNRTLAIYLITVIAHDTREDSYALAINSMRCYARLHGYMHRLVYDVNYLDHCKHKDHFFRRHCIVSIFLRATPPGAWMLFLDADIAVVNPNRLIEEFIDARYDITLFDRFFNWEVSANSYIVRHSSRGLAFVDAFADYEYKLPNSFHGWDNGALHLILLDLLHAVDSTLTYKCRKVWENSMSFDDLFIMEACVRLALGDRVEFPEKGLRILPKGEAWVRDIWLLGSTWSDGDFMLHGLKSTLARHYTDTTNILWQRVARSWNSKYPDWESILHYIPPITKHLDLSKCQSGTELWHLDNRTLISESEKRKQLFVLARQVETRKYETIKKLADF